jgi:hypothetical protein
MTAQIMDTLVYEGREYCLADEPLWDWLERKRNRRMRFVALHSGCWRGYESRWEVAEGRLYLTLFKARLPDGSAATIEGLFVNYSQEFYRAAGALDPANDGPGRFAFWVNGALHCPLGRLLEYRHVGYSSVYERELVLVFRSGFLVGSRIRDRPAAASGLLGLQ